MLILSLFILLIYSSVSNSAGTLTTNNRAILKVGVLVILSSLYLLVDLPLASLYGEGAAEVYLYNDLYVLNSFNLYMIGLVFFSVLSLLTMNLVQMGREESKDGLQRLANVSWLNNLAGPGQIVAGTNKYYVSIVIFNLLGVILLITSNNIISVYLGIELQSYSLYILTGLTQKSQASGHNSLFYYLIGGLGSIVILYGLSLLYYTSGNVYLNNIGIFMDYALFRDNLLVGWLFVLFGLLIKIGAAPMYSWSVLLYMNSHTIITAYISLIPKISILSYVWFLYKNIGVSPILESALSMDSKTALVLSTIISLSLIIGSIGGLTQVKIKAILAYSGLLNIGYLLLSVLVDSTNSLVAYIVYISQYSLNHIAIFLLLIIAALYSKSANQSHLTYMYELGNLRKNVYLVIGLLVIMGSFIGVPPLFGFYGKYYLLISAVNGNYIFLSLLLIVSSIVSTGFYLYFLNVVIIRKEEEDTDINESSTVVPLAGNTLTYVFSSLVLAILFNFLQWQNILKGAYIIANGLFPL